MLFSTHFTHSIKAALTTVLLLSASIAGRADLVTLEFSGTYDLSGSIADSEGLNEFGTEGTTGLPYLYTLIYDTSLNTSMVVVPVGGALGLDTALSSFYGYSVSGIVSFTRTFGDADLAFPISPRGVADFFFNTDIASATPTAAWLHSVSTAGILDLGGAFASPAGVDFYIGRSDMIYRPDRFIDVTGQSFDMVITRSVSTNAVSEATSTSALVGLAFGFIVWLRRRR